MKNESKIINPVLATEASPKMGERYQFASTNDIIKALEPTGWKVAETKIAKVRNKDNEGFQRHIVTLENPLFPFIPGLTDTNKSKPEIVIMNSHDGGTALRMMLGFLRIACLNGNIGGTGLREFRAVHSGNLESKLVGGVEYMTEGLPQLFEQIQSLQQLKFSQDKLELFVRTLVDERLARINTVNVDYSSAMNVRRTEDKAVDALTVFSRVQEALIRGGIKFTAQREKKDKEGNPTGVFENYTSTTRKISSLQQSVRLNQLAYDLAIELAA